MASVHLVDRNLKWATLLLAALPVWVGGCGSGQREPLPCLERAVFGDPAASPYVLPYPAGNSYRLAQGYCYPHGGHRNQLAYDFEMPIGGDVVAAQGGVVRRVRDDLPDTGAMEDAGQYNNLLIEHKDGTVAFYGHLRQGSIVVQVGQRVTQGQRIAASGNSGNTQGAPHLHFGVYQSWPATEGFDVGVNFRNAKGPLDERRGLIAGATYEALSY